MAHYSGSGKWVKLQSGIITFGKDNETYGTASAYAWSYGVRHANGLRLGGIGYLNLTGLSEFAVGDVQGYTGTIRIYTQFDCPYDLIIWDPDNDLSRIVATYKTVRFEKGFCVSIT